MTSPSGEQYEIAAGEQRAVITEVGGGVRLYRHGAREVLQPYPLDAICDGAHGTPLVPWPNRLADGRYEFDGADHQLALTEPEKNNAIHGLLRWSSWAATSQAGDRVTMATRLYPQPGYPFALDVSVDYVLGEGGLTVTTTATNVGTVACPYGCGQHPYLSPGSGLIDECTLQLAAATRIDTDAERQLPTGRVPVAGTEYDFRAGKLIGDLEVDFAFVDLDRDDSGRFWVRLTGADGACAELWTDEAYPFIEIYTAGTLATDRRRRGLGAEAMTCPPNAFATGESVIRLEPGESTTAAWGVRLA